VCQREMSFADLVRARFLPAVPDALRPALAGRADLTESLASATTDAQRTWPDVVVDDATWLAWLGERAPAVEPSEPIFGELHVADLFFACACAAQNTPAIAMFEARIVPSMARALSGLRLGEAERDELLQRLREKLLVRSGDEPPRVARYAGRGPLRGWAKVVAVREGRDALRRAGRSKEVPSDDAVLELGVGLESPELAILKAGQREAFGEAVRAALDALEPGERVVLRYHYVEGLTVDTIGRILSLHRASAARRIAKARQHLLTGTRMVLRERLGVNRSELDSMLRLIGSQLHVSLPRLFDSKQG